MPVVPLDNLTISELGRLKEDIDLAIIDRRQSELMDLRYKIDDLIDSSEFTLQEVLDARPVRKPVQPKYRNPNDNEQTWTGRGRKPRWVEECINNGINLTDLLI